MTHMLQCYIANPTTKERLLVLPNQKGVELGRGSPLLEVNDNRCSRRQLVVTFDRDSERVTINACGGNPVEIRPKGKKAIILKKGSQYSLSTGDGFCFIPDAPELHFVIDMDNPKRGPGDLTKGLSTQSMKVEKDASLTGAIKRQREEEEKKKEDKPAQPVTKKRKVEDDEATIELKATPVSAASSDTSGKTPCMYGEKCYSKNPKHLQKYSHPSKGDEVVAGSKPKAEKKLPEKVVFAKQEEEEEEEEKPKAEVEKPKEVLKKPKAKPPCKFGANCYDNSEKHLQRFSHDVAGEKELPKKKEPKNGAKKESKPDVAWPDLPKAASKKGKEKEKTESSGGTTELSGKKIVITGALSMFLRKDLVEKLKKAGATVMSGISSNTDILIAGDKAGGKLQKAEELGVQVWDEAKLTEVFANIEKSNAKEESAFDGEEGAEGVDPYIGLGSDEETGEDIDSKLPKPKNLMQDGETYEAASNSSTTTYTIKRCFGGIYYCTCPAWRNQNLPVDQRSCKHLREHLGEAYETARVGTAASAPVVRSASNKTAPALLLAHKWEKDAVDPTGWWISEKLDGVRAYWDGKKFISRLGNPFSASNWFTAGLPSDMELDGELFGGRGKFQTTVSVVKSQGEDKRWKGLKFMIFDAPKLAKPFEERMKILKDYFDAHPAGYAQLVEHEVCKGVKHLEMKLQKVEALKGEGLMLRQPGSLYKAGRSTTLLKVKSFHDAEARVVGYEGGKGKHKGRTGALQVEMANGTKFKVGTGLSDKERENPPKIGAIITYRFQELTPDGVPRFPSYVGERVDMVEPKDPDLPNLKKKSSD